jgi:hypothetical protein
MKKLNIHIHDMTNGNKTVTIETNGHIDLSISDYEDCGLMGNNVNFTMFDFTQSDLINLRDKINEAIK